MHPSSRKAQADGYHPLSPMAFGQSRSHSMVATKRRFNPNLQKVRIQDGGRTRRVYVCTRCLKSNKVTKAA
jgi:large subunit ribosomal protein L28